MVRDVVRSGWFVTLYLTTFWTLEFHLADRATAEDSSPNRTPIAVGAAQIDITPDYAVRLTGYGSRRRESEGVAQRIWAKSIAIGRDEPALLLSVDNCGMTPAIRNEVATRLRQKVGLPSERLVISVTHTHTAPCLTNWAPYIFGQDIPDEQQSRIDRYTRELTDRLVEVALQSLENRRPAHIYSTDTTADFAANRRVIVGGKWTGFGVQADGPVDRSLPILIAKDMDGKVLAVVANYACHCTTLGGNFNEICGDWAGFAAQYIQQGFDGAVALITIGCGADANPEPRGSLELCRQHGRELADRVLAAVQDEASLRPLPTLLRCRLLNIDLPFADLPTRAQWQQTVKEGGRSAYHAEKFLQRLDHGEKIPSTLSYPVATWTFGDQLAMVFLGGEVVVDYAIRLRQEFDNPKLWITAYANAVPCYIPSKRILREGGYEADRSMDYYARPTRFAESVEDLIVDSVQKLLPAEFYSRDKQRNFPPPRTPENALRSITTPPGYVVELVAAEPLVADPVAFDWGADGRLWVVEMRDYPNGMGWQREGHPLAKPGGRVKVLTDYDGDGRYDTAQIVLDNLAFPTGIKVWRNGILVTTAPEILYAEDTDGDGRVDKRETLYEGFGEGNQQHRVNGLVWGLDGWLYVSNGDSDGKIRSTRTGEVVELRGRDLRIRPDQGALQPQSGRTQFGRSCDSHGNWFGGNNSNPLWHYVLDDYYLKRNPHFAARDVRHEVPEQPGPAIVYPTSRTLSRFNDFSRANRFTSACSPIVFRDDSLIGTEFNRYTYVCEPVHNLVHREILESNGVTFSSRRLPEEQQSEFLASDDNWFRPVMVRTGPDGALWIADMYRFVIEHPEWIPQDWQRKLDLRAGDDRGRIYRVRLPGIPSPTSWRDSQLPRLDQLSVRQLVAELDCANGTKRDMIQQLLQWRSDPACIDPLKRLVADPVWVQSAAHALYLLEELDALPDELLLTQIQHADDVIKRHAIRIAERRLNQSDEFGAVLLDRTDYPAQSAFARHVHQQLAYSLGEWDDQRAGDGLAQLAMKHRDDSFITSAVLSSVNKTNLGPFVAAILQQSKQTPPPAELAEQLFGFAVAMDQTDVVDDGLAILRQLDDDRHADWQLAAVLGVLGASSRSSQSFLDRLDRNAREMIDEQVTRARAVVEDSAASEHIRLVAVRLLGRNPSAAAADIRSLALLLSPQVSAKLQAASIDALGRFEDARAVDALLGDWASLTPSVRSQILDTLLSRTSRTLRLLAAVERGEIATSLIDARRRQQLVLHRSAAIRQKAAALFNKASADRESVLQQYQSALTLSSNPQRGKLVFDRHCSKCHRLDGAGHSVGPDLSALTDKSAHSLLTAILDPNRAVEDKFLDYIAVSTEGLQHTGMIADETASSITLTGPDGKQTILLRNQIELLRSSGKSLMPEGMEKDVSHQDLADLMAYTRQFTLQPNEFPGNHPSLVRAAANGSMRLSARDCRIYGPRLVFEQKHGNLGWWTREDDRAVWSLEIPQSGLFRVMLDYACQDESAGNRFQLTIAGQSLTGVIAGTGTWDDYVTRQIGQLELPAGPADAVFQSAGRIKSTLLDLRTIRLEPVSP